MAMHRRTLNRRLATSGTSTSEQLEDVRSHIARQLVADTGLSMIEIASTLNCSDASTFTRAFRRWTDMSPCEWRSRLKRESLSTRSSAWPSSRAGGRSAYRADATLGG